MLHNWVMNVRAECRPWLGCSQLLTGVMAVLIVDCIFRQCTWGEARKHKYSLEPLCVSNLLTHFPVALLTLQDYPTTSPRMLFNSSPPGICTLVVIENHSALAFLLSFSVMFFYFLSLIRSLITVKLSLYT